MIPNLFLKSISFVHLNTNYLKVFKLTIIATNFYELIKSLLLIELFSFSTVWHETRSF